MASAGDGGRPRLPETDDPYVLLGLERDAELKAIRQAYARLIKIYRPDQAPAEFQRIHAAFEELKPQRAPQARAAPLRELQRESSLDSMTSQGAPRDGEVERDLAATGERRVDVPDRDPAAASAPSASTDEPSTAPPLPRVRDRLEAAGQAFERGELGSARAIIEALLDERVPLDVLLADEHLKIVLDSSALSWGRLARASSDLQEVAAAWLTAWSDAFERDPARAASYLDDDRLRLDAADFPDLAAACLRRIGATYWRHDYDALGLLEKYRRALPAQGAIDHLFDSVELELAAARALGRVKGRRGLIGKLESLLIAARVGSQATCRRDATRMLEFLSADPMKSLAELEEVCREEELVALFELIYDYLPVDLTRLAAMSKPRLALLSGALHQAGERGIKWPTIAGGAGVAGLGALVVGALPVAGALAVAAGVGFATEPRRYRLEIRPRLVRALMSVPVTSGVISRWVRLNGRLAGRLSRFDIAIENDTALYALSMIVSLASYIGGYIDD